jgi:microcystin-dependent protein
MYNDTTGNVGIGTKTPTAKLDVNGKINTSSDFTINQVSIAPPIGSITAYTLATSPPGWLICDGSQVSRTTYASLFAVIGVTFGPGNNSTTFTLPNYQGAFLRGTGTNGSYSGPSLNTSQAHATQTHTHTASSVVTDPGHAHSQTTVNDDYNNSGGNAYPVGSNPSFAAYDSSGIKTWSNINSSTTRVTVATTVGNSTTSVNANETRPYNFGVYWIIKY